MPRTPEEMVEFRNLAQMCGTSAAIELTEKLGQTRVVQQKELLPSDCNPKSRAVLEAAGVVFGEREDKFFLRATLPEGWKKVRTDHSMWSDLVDARGRKRAGIFYKAAYYDESAYMSVSRRFTVTLNYKHPRYEQGMHQAVVHDGDRVIFCTKGIVLSKDKRYTPSGREAVERDEGIARSWLLARYPDYENPASYWDEEDLPTVECGE